MQGAGAAASNEIPAAPVGADGWVTASYFVRSTRATGAAPRLTLLVCAQVYPEHAHPEPRSLARSPPQGMACPSTSSATAVPCSAGSYSLGGAFKCTACLAGKHCATPHAAPIACAAGNFAAPSAANCTCCPAGYECGGGGGVRPVLCREGPWAGGGAINCSACQPARPSTPSAFAF